MKPELEKAIFCRDGSRRPDHIAVVFLFDKDYFAKKQMDFFVNQIVFLHLAIYFMLSTLVMKRNESSSELFYRNFSARRITKVMLHFEVNCEP